MTSTLATAQETFTLLRRDRVFFPALIAGIFMIFMTSIVSEFTVEEIRKLFYDIGFATFNFTGSIVAILWGTKLLSDAKHDGSMNIQLAAPVDRGSWLLGKILGMVLALVAFGVLLAIMLMLTMVLDNFAEFHWDHVLILSGYILSWVVLSALAIFFSTFSSQAIAMFSTLSFWIMGLAAEPLGHVITNKTHVLTRQFVEGLQVVWNFQNFNLSGLVANSGGEVSHIPQKFLYGLTLIGCISIAAIFVFRRRNLE